MATKTERRKARRVDPQREDVTPERAGRNDFASMGMARRLVPVIDTLKAKGQLSDTEWSALAYYRDQASLADRSPVRSCCDTSPRGGNGPGVAIVSAMIETGRMERDMGQLADIARAVVVDDLSLTEWCIRKHGSRQKAGRIVPVGNDDTVQFRLKLARMELRIASHRIVKG